MSKILFTGKTHTTGGRNGAGHSLDGGFDIDLPAPHPAAERLFAVAWSACFIGALELAAGQKKVALTETPAVDAEVDLVREGNEFFLQARLNVSVPGVDRETAQALVDAAHAICPYSKATRGNIDVTVTLV